MKKNWNRGKSWSDIWPFSLIMSWMWNYHVKLVKFWGETSGESHCLQPSPEQVTCLIPACHLFLNTFSILQFNNLDPPVFLECHLYFHWTHLMISVIQRLGLWHKLTLHWKGSDSLPKVMHASYYWTDTFFSFAIGKHFEKRWDLIGIFT